ncbi:MAG: hypothetical protein AB1810_01530 [Pseudomonadota bacterium]
MKYAVFFIVLLVSLGANMPDGVIARLGLEPNYLIALGICAVFTWMCVGRHTAVMVAIALLSIGANLTAASAQGMGIDRDVLAALMFSMVILPALINLIGWDV